MTKIKAGVAACLLLAMQGASVTWSQKQRERATGTGTRDASRLKEGDSRAAERVLLDFMRKNGDRTLARYVKPDGIDPALVIRQGFSFYFK